MNNKHLLHIFIVFIFIFFVSAVMFLSNRQVSVKNVDKFFSNPTEKSELDLCKKLLKSMERKDLNIIGVSKNKLLNDSILEYNPRIVSNNEDINYIVLYSINKDLNMEYLTIFEKNKLYYKQIGSPLSFRNVLDIFLLPIDTEEKYILFVRELDGAMSNPLDVLVSLHGYVYINNKKTFNESINIIENMEEYRKTSTNPARFRKYRAKSDIVLTNNEFPELEVLTYCYEALSAPIKDTALENPPYGTEFDVIKTTNLHEKYFYDNEYKHFLQGYITLDKNNEKVGILKKNLKLVDNNHIDTYTVINKSGVIFEVFKNYTIDKIN